MSLSVDEMLAPRRATPLIQIGESSEEARNAYTRQLSPATPRPAANGASALPRLFPRMGLVLPPAPDTLTKPRLRLPRKLRGLLTPHRYKVLYGGRGGAKSHGVARTLLLLCARFLDGFCFDDIPSY